MLPRVILASLLSASSVLADGAAIAAAITTIQDATVQLGTTVATWDGGILSAIPITVDSATLLEDINTATRTARASAALSDVEAVTVGLGIISLVTNVNSTLTTLIAAKPKFDQTLLTGVVLLNLELEKAASGRFSDAVIAKLPATFVSTGQTLAAEITASFNVAIDAYNGPFL